MKITVALLIYKSVKYLDFVMNSLLDVHSSNHNIRYLIVCNDATKNVIQAAKDWEYSSRINPENLPMIETVVHENKNKDEWWIQNVYNAWNRALKECKTEYICFVNSDMAFTEGWLDNLAKYDTTQYIPTSRLIESGRMPSLQGLISRNFGQKIQFFDKKRFQECAREVSKNVFKENVGAFMPSLFKCETLRSIGGWSKNIGNFPGDKITFTKLRRKYGMRHVMVCDSIVYHFQRGESAESNDLK